MTSNITADQIRPGMRLFITHNDGTRAVVRALRTATLYKHSWRLAVTYAHREGVTTLSGKTVKVLHHA